MDEVSTSYALGHLARTSMDLRGAIAASRVLQSSQLDSNRADADPNLPRMCVVLILLHRRCYAVVDIFKYILASWPFYIGVPFSHESRTGHDNGPILWAASTGITCRRGTIASKLCFLTLDAFTACQIIQRVKRSDPQELLNADIGFYSSATSIKHSPA